jgi:hypothetical protein
MKIEEAIELTDGVTHSYYGATLDKILHAFGFIDGWESRAEEIYLLKQAIENKNQHFIDCDSVRLERDMLLSHSRTTVVLVNKIDILRDALKVAPCHCCSAMEFECVRCSALEETE